MISQKMKLLSVVVGAAALIVTPALAGTIHKRTSVAFNAYASADRAYGANAYGANIVVGMDGKIIGADPDPNIRFQLLREGHFDAE
jgi:hypothetical protein